MRRSESQLIKKLLKDFPFLKAMPGEQVVEGLVRRGAIRVRRMDEHLLFRASRDSGGVLSELYSDTFWLVEEELIRELPPGVRIGKRICLVDFRGVRAVLCAEALGGNPWFGATIYLPPQAHELKRFRLYLAAVQYNT